MTEPFFCGSLPLCSFYCEISTSTGMFLIVSTEMMVICSQGNVGLVKNGGTNDDYNGAQIELGTLGLEPRRLHGSSESYKVKVDGERLDEQIQEPVALLKMDVEGYEPTAFESARKVFEKYG
jgi:hypothetical protein